MSYDIWKYRKYTNFILSTCLILMSPQSLINESLTLGIGKICTDSEKKNNVIFSTVGINKQIKLEL